MRLAFFGNNLDQGTMYVKFFRHYGIEATHFSFDYPMPQEHHDWWSASSANSAWVFPINGLSFYPDYPGRLTDVAAVRRIYEVLRQYDILLMAETGPALFSEMDGVKKVFLSLGYDLQVLPFMVKTFFPAAKLIKSLLGTVARGKLQQLSQPLRNYCAYGRLERRQRKGLLQCDALVCYSGHQDDLVRRLTLDPGKVHYLPVPMDWDILGEIDWEHVKTLTKTYEGIDRIYFHPTRQFFLKLDANPFLKDNHKLLLAYAKFIKISRENSRLLLVDKGREEDLAAAKSLIRKLNLEHHVEWLPEMPNRKLRSYYQLQQVVVCDQYSPRLATLGNVGREASCYGRILITAFNRKWNVSVYGEDLPPHIYPACSTDAILRAMIAIEGLGPDQSVSGSIRARNWARRIFHRDVVVPKYLNVIVHRDPPVRGGIWPNCRCIPFCSRAISRRIFDNLLTGCKK